MMEHDQKMVNVAYNLGYKKGYQEGIMKIKIGTILEDSVIQELKIFAAKEKKQINEVIQEALTAYFQGDVKKQKLRLNAVKRLCSR